MGVSIGVVEDTVDVSTAFLRKSYDSIECLRSRHHDLSFLARSSFLRRSGEELFNPDDFELPEPFLLDPILKGDVNLVLPFEQRHNHLLFQRLALSNLELEVFFG